jgi:hypothetical protein
MADFVSGRATDLTRCVSYHETLAAEIEAERVANEAKAKASQKKKRNRRGASHYRPTPPVPFVPNEFQPCRIGSSGDTNLDPFHGCDAPYETNPEMTRIHETVRRIRAEQKVMQDAFDALVNPNSKARRTLKRFMKRTNRLIDTLPNRR